MLSAASPRSQRAGYRTPREPQCSAAASQPGSVGEKQLYLIYFL